jgi:hypothetical protein
MTEKRLKTKNDWGIIAANSPNWVVFRRIPPEYIAFAWSDPVAHFDICDYQDQGAFREATAEL